MLRDLLVFDLDGTLVDSRQDLADAVNRLIVENGGRSLDTDAVVHMVGEGVEKLVTRAFTAAGLLPVPPGSVTRFLHLYGERLLVNTRPYDGIEEALESLSDLAVLAVLTNKPRAFAESILDGLGLARYFARVVGGDGPEARKPAPDGLLRLIGEAGATVESTTLVGDSVIDLMTARAAGTRVVLMKYGFGFPDIPREQMYDDAFVAEAPGDLVRHLRGRV